MTPHDPWTEVITPYGFTADQVISALQKEIRRGNTENAVLLAYEMMTTSPGLEEYLWQRLEVISVEDIGFGELDAPVVVHILRQMVSGLDQSVGERQLFAVHAVRYLCSCQKDRSSDEMLYWIKLSVASGASHAEIPDYALDMHTAEGKRRGRGKRHFYEEGVQTIPELPQRVILYRERIMKLLDESELK